jgi:hypothetical protein
MCRILVTAVLVIVTLYNALLTLLISFGGIHADDSEETCPSWALRLFRLAAHSNGVRMMPGTMCGRHSLWTNHKIQYQIMVVGAKSNALDAQR